MDCTNEKRLVFFTSAQLLSEGSVMVCGNI